MMIWFSGLSRILNNTCCNNVNKKIKQIKKRICECDVFWHKYAYWMTLSAASVCFKGNKQITNFFISATLEIAYFPHGFLNFFKREWRHIFLGASSQDRKWSLFSTLFLLLRMRSWRNAWHQLYQSRKSSAEWRAETDLFIDVIVIELYVIKI